jgi:hypothetical protein
VSSPDEFEAMVRNAIQNQPNRVKAALEALMTADGPVDSVTMEYEDGTMTITVIDASGRSFKIIA